MKTGLTGGIGSGKSYVAHLLAERGIEVYDCDSAAKRLMRTSPELRQQLTDLIGPEAYEPYEPYEPHTTQPPYLLNKAAVARFLLASEENARAVDAIVHPAVFRDFQQSGALWMESAILYESGAASLVDRVIVVTAPEELRISRIMARDGISREKAREWISRQWPQERVRELADYEIVNDGTTDLEQQLNKIIEQCKTPF